MSAHVLTEICKAVTANAERQTFIRTITYVREVGIDANDEFSDESCLVATGKCLIHVQAAGLRCLQLKC